jgi:hypothetical protein
MRTWLAIPAAALVAVLMLAETPSANSGAVLNLTAITANVAGAPDAVRIEILRWSTDEERQRLSSAWDLKNAAPAKPAAAGKGAAKAAAKGKGAGKGPASPGANAPQTPETSLTRALQEATTVGYLWSSEMAGYALRYAGKFDNPDGSQRIILITQRKLGAVNQLWRPTVDGPSNPYEFSVIELRLNAKGEGEGKASLTGKIAADAAAKIVTVENYNASPVIFREVRKATVHK